MASYTEVPSIISEINNTCMHIRADPYIGLLAPKS